MELQNWPQQVWNTPISSYNQQPFGNYNNTLQDYSHAQSKIKDTTLGNFLPFLLTLNLAAPTTPLTPLPLDVRSGSPVEETGPLKTWYRWNLLDFKFPSERERARAISNRAYVPENNVPLGLAPYKDRLFVSIPKWRDGIPSTLNVLPSTPQEPSPKLVPYPSWDWHNSGSCDGLTSVYRMQADTCGRLWVLDSGLVNTTGSREQVCPPQLLIFNLVNDKLISRYRLPSDFLVQGSLFSNIALDIRDGDCGDIHAYLSDVWGYAIVVYSLNLNRAWRISHHYFLPDPSATLYQVENLKFDWTDGLFGLTLSPYDKVTRDRYVYFHPMTSFNEYYVRASDLRNETRWTQSQFPPPLAEDVSIFNVVGQSRGPNGHSSCSAMDRNGILFYNLVTRNSVGCWDSRKLYKRENLGIVANSETTLIFPNDMRIDDEERQSVWVLVNKLPLFIYQRLNTNLINFRIMSAYTDEAVAGTICDPGVYSTGTFDNYYDGCQ